MYVLTSSIVRFGKVLSLDKCLRMLKEHVLFSNAYQRYSLLSSFLALGSSTEECLHIRFLCTVGKSAGNLFTYNNDS